MFRARGRVVDASGRPPRAVVFEIALRRPMEASTPTQPVSTYNATSGDFEIRDIATGSYVVRAITPPDPAAGIERAVGQTELQFVDLDVANVLLRSVAILPYLAESMFAPRKQAALQPIFRV